MRILYSILIFIVVIGIFCYLTLSAIASSVVSERLTTILKVPVSVGNIFFSNKLITIQDFVIYNPKQKHSDKAEAFRVKSIKIQAPYRNYFSDPIEINQVELNKVFVTIEYFNEEQSESNWVFLDKKLDAPASAKDEKKERAVQIKTLVINGVEINQVFLNNTSKHYYLKEGKKNNQIILHNINTDRGLPMQKITQAVIHKLLQQITIIKGINTLLKFPEVILDEITKPFKSTKKQNESAPQ